MNAEKEKYADSKKREDKARIREINKELKSIEDKIIEESKPRIKELFDYEIPIAMVKDAGITTTGAKSENNELPKLVEDFAAYNEKAKLWQHSDGSVLYKYNIEKDGSVVRIFDGKKDVLA